MKSNQAGFYRLEDRVLFEAGAVVQAAEAAAAESGANAEVAVEAETATQNDVQSDIADLASVELPPEVIAETAEESEPAKTLVVINSSVADADKIVNDLGENYEILRLEAGTDALDTINDYLDAHADTEYSALHIVSHGNDGYITLNGEKIDNATLNPADWKAIGEHLTDDADILIYGCNTAKSDEGKALVQTIANLTGADVAASTDTTGATGNWNMEYKTGLIEAATLQPSEYTCDLTSPDTVYVSVLSDKTWTDGAEWDADNGYDNELGITLREAIAYAKAEASEKIAFSMDVDWKNLGDGKKTIVLTGGELVIDASITIDGALTFKDVNQGIITIKVPVTYAESVKDNITASDFRVFNVSQRATLRNMIVKGGLVNSGGTINASAYLIMEDMMVADSGATTGGGGIYASGGLYAENVTVCNNTLTTASWYRYGGGGLCLSGQSYLINCTIFGNTSKNNYVGGSALFAAGGVTYLIGSTVTGNTDTYTAKMVAAVVTDNTSSYLYILDSIVVGNSSKADIGTYSADRCFINIGDSIYGSVGARDKSDQLNNVLHVYNSREITDAKMVFGDTTNILTDENGIFYIQPIAGPAGDGGKGYEILNIKSNYYNTVVGYFNEEGYFCDFKGDRLVHGSWNATDAGHRTYYTTADGMTFTQMIDSRGLSYKGSTWGFFNYDETAKTSSDIPSSPGNLLYITKDGFVQVNPGEKITFSGITNMIAGENFDSAAYGAQFTAAGLTDRFGANRANTLGAVLPPPSVSIIATDHSTDEITDDGTTTYGDTVILSALVENVFAGAVYSYKWTNSTDPEYSKTGTFTGSADGNTITLEALKMVAESGIYTLSVWINGNEAGAVTETKEVTINKKEVQVSVDSDKPYSVQYGDDFDVSGVLLNYNDGFVNGDTAEKVFGSGLPAIFTTYTQGKDVGEYELKWDVQPAETENYTFTYEEISLKLSVTEREITITAANIVNGSQVYNGSNFTHKAEKVATGYNNETITVELTTVGSEAKVYGKGELTWNIVAADPLKAGNYTVSLADDVSLEIVPDTPTVTIDGLAEGKLSFTYGDTVSVSATATAGSTDISSRGTISYKYYTEDQGVYAELRGTPVNAGTYYVKAFFTSENSNYADMESDYTLVEIAPDTPTVAITGLVDGKLSFIYGDTVSVSATASADNTDISGNGTISYVYYRKDGITEISGMPVNAGRYYVKACFTSNSDNYTDSESGLIELTVKQRTITAEAYSGSLTYNGSEQCLSVKLADGSINQFAAADHRFEVTDSDKETDAGTYADKTVTFKIVDENNTDVSANYDFTAILTGTLEIAAKAVTIKVSGETAEKVYDGNEYTAGFTFTCTDDLFNKECTESNILLNGQTISITGTNVADSGILTLTVDKLTCSNTNFAVTFTVEDGAEKVELAITPKPVSVDWTGENGSATDFEWIYTGDTFKPAAKLDTGIDGETAGIIVETDASGNGAGEYTAAAVISGNGTFKADNYSITGLTQTYKVINAALNVTAENVSGTADGSGYSVAVNAATVDGTGAVIVYGTTDGDYSLTESPVFTEAGTYTVYYQVSAANHNTVTGSATVTLTALPDPVPPPSDPVPVPPPVVPENRDSIRSEATQPGAPDQSSLGTVMMNHSVMGIGSGNSVMISSTETQNPGAAGLLFSMEYRNQLKRFEKTSVSVHAEMGGRGILLSDIIQQPANNGENIKLSELKCGETAVSDHLNGVKDARTEYEEKIQELETLLDHSGDFNFSDMDFSQLTVKAGQFRDDIDLALEEMLAV